MANNLDQTGVIQVDGAWATSVKYAADALGPNVGSVDLRFMQGRAEVGRVAVSREHLSELLGEKNRSAIERHIANDADKYLPVVTGELRGGRLHYQEVTLATSKPRAVENSIARRRSPIGAPARRQIRTKLASRLGADGRRRPHESGCRRRTRQGCGEAASCQQDPSGGAQRRSGGTRARAHRREVSREGQYLSL